MSIMKKPNNREELFRTEISILSLFDQTTRQERIVSARCVNRCNISHRKSLFEKRITEFIEKNYTISEMAKLCNMSVTAFKKRFAEYYELPPHRWFVKQHLHRAAELLLSEDLSIKEISHKCHFTNQSQFANRFRREYGLTPKQYQERYGIKSRKVVADAGYGSEQNCNYMLENEIVPYVKYNYFHKERKRKFKDNPYLQQNLTYDKDRDVFVCPNNKELIHTETYTRTTELGYESKVDRYVCEDCSNCPLKNECTKAKGNREIEVNHTLNDYKRLVRELLTSERGVYHRYKRPIEPEAVFGQIKDAHHFRRFHLRSMSKVNIEFGLVAMAHNLRQLAKLITDRPNNGNNNNNNNSKTNINNHRANRASKANMRNIDTVNLYLAQISAA
ncbi:MAG: transposase [Alistipes sp.]|nr:transposase [Alistipes sp.]